MRRGGRDTSYFRSDLLYLAASSLQFFGGLVITPMVTRLLSPSEFGTVASSMAVMQLCVAVCGFGLGTAIQRGYVQADGRLKSRRLLGFAVMMALLSALTLDLLGPWWSGLFGFERYSTVLRLAVWWAGLSAATLAQLARFRSAARLRDFAIVCFLQSICGDFLALGMLFWHQPTAEAYLWARCLAQLAAFGFALCVQPFRLFGPRDLPLIRGALRFSLPLVPALAATFVINSADRLVINHVLAPGDVGRYQIAATLGNLPIILVSMLYVSWQPRFFAAGGDANDSVHESREALYRLVPWLLLGLNGLAPFLLAVWAPAEYDTSSLLLVTALVSVGLIPAAASQAANRALIVHGYSGSVALSSIAAACLSLVSNLVLVRLLGLEGAAISSVLAYVVMHRTLLWFATRVGYRPRPPRLLLVVLLGTGALVIGLALLPQTGWGAWLHALVTLVAAGGGLHQLLRLAHVGMPEPAQESVPG